jgi:hypothetical protein
VIINARNAGTVTDGLHAILLVQAILIIHLVLLLKVIEPMIQPILLVATELKQRLIAAVLKSQNHLYH